MADRSAPVLGGGTVELDSSAFEARFNMPLVHETVRAELNARRRGTASTLTRGKVSGGGAKPWRQKGTGRARQGSIRAPHFAGGGTVFGPSPRSYTFKVNRKARRAALRSALSVHAERESLAVFDASVFDAPSTSRAADLLDSWGPSGALAPTLVLLGEHEAAAGKSFRNIARVAVMPVGDAGVADVIGAASLLISEVALPELVARASGSGESAATVPAPAETPVTARAAETAEAPPTPETVSADPEPPAAETTEAAADPPAAGEAAAEAPETAPDAEEAD
jgi:large subunit ribosomal protein L4